LAIILKINNSDPEIFTVRVEDEDKERYDDKRHTRIYGRVSRLDQMTLIGACREVGKHDLQSAKGRRSGDAKKLLEGFLEEYLKRKSTQSTSQHRECNRSSLSNLRKMQLPCRYFIPTQLTTMRPTGPPKSRILPDGRFYIGRAKFGLVLSSEAAQVFQHQKFHEMQTEALRMNTQPTIYNTQTKRPDEERRWKQFVVGWNEFVGGEFRDNCTRLWPNHGGRDAVKFVDISLPSGLLSQDGCELQSEHTDYMAEPEFEDVFSVIAVFGVHARIVHIREFVCTLLPGD
jgi:hypothetical protein